MTAVTTWEEALAAAAEETGVEAIADRALAALVPELPVLREDPDLLEAARSSALANVALATELVRGTMSPEDMEPPPQATAFARALARRNVPVAELDRAYRVAQVTLWRWAVDEVRARVDADVADAIEGLSEAVFALGDIFSLTVMRRYAAERERWLRSAEAVRAATVQEVLAGGPVDVAAASARLRYELRHAHVAFVVWSEGETEAPESAAAAVGGPGALLVPLGTGTVAGWCAPGGVQPEAGGAVAVALGTPAADVEGFRRSHAEALEARRVARLSGRAAPGLVRYADVALLALLTQDAEQARRFAAAVLGPLAGGEEAMRKLADTLLVALEEQGSPRRAAARLGVHENTVAKRLRSVEELVPGGTAGRTAELLAALVIARTMR